MIRVDFSRRSTETELMDTEVVDAEDFRRCLADLAVVNRLTLARRPTLAWLDRATAGLPRGATFSLLDVGFGHGDMLRAIRLWAERRGLDARLEGVDLNPLSARAAEGATPSALAITYRTGDLFDEPTDRRFDFIISSLFTHHLTDAQIVAFLRWMSGQAAIGWFINDLHRHAVAYHAFRLLSAAAGWHRFVRHDGPVSIARSFRREDWTRLLQTAGVTAEIAWRVPFRFCVGHIGPRQTTAS